MDDLRRIGASVWLGLTIVVGLGMAHSPQARATEQIPDALLTDTFALDDFTFVDNPDLIQNVSSTRGGPIWVAGTEATFLAPIITGTTVETVIVSNGSGNGLGVIDDLGLEMMTFAPRVWLGINNGDGWGLVTRFWYLNDEQLDAANIPDGPDFFSFQGENRLKMYNVDLEVTRGRYVHHVYRWSRCNRH